MARITIELTPGDAGALRYFLESAVSVLSGMVVERTELPSGEFHESKIGPTTDYERLSLAVAERVEEELRGKTEACLKDGRSL